LKPRAPVTLPYDPVKVKGVGMLRMIRDWISAWATTLHIMIFERETYRLLCSDIDMSEDMIEVRAPYMSCYLATDDTPGEIIPELARLIREPRQVELPTDGGYVVLPAESEAADCELYTEYVSSR
jgi:hypothetical protein